MWVGGQRNDPADSPPGKSRYPLYRRLGGPKAGLEGAEKSSQAGIRSVDRPALSESLYRLRYSGPHAGTCSGVLENLFCTRRKHQ
jgi:hypothetical protein